MLSKYDKRIHEKISALNNKATYIYFLVTSTRFDSSIVKHSVQINSPQMRGPLTRET